MTNTAAPERATQFKIAAPGDRLIILNGVFDGHMGTLVSTSPIGACRVRLDITGKVSLYNRDELAYPTGERLETHEEQNVRERKARTLDRLHSQTKTLRATRSNREAAIMAMAARYGAAERLKGDLDRYDLDLAYDAADRRHSALQRLVYGD